MSVAIVGDQLGSIELDLLKIYTVTLYLSYVNRLEINGTC